MAILMHNEKTGDVKITNANYDGKVFLGYIKEGFKPLCMVWGQMLVARPFVGEDKELYDLIYEKHKDDR